MNIKRVFTCIFATITTLSLLGQAEPYKNVSLSAEERAADLVGRLTLQEKALLMRDVSPTVERLGIAPYNWWNEALHGVARAGLATVFPQTIGMAASFNDSLVYKVFDVISDEARAKHHDSKRKGEHGRYQGLTFWTPNINIFRDPRWGRGQETYGEDPYLTARMGLAAVYGLQGPEDAKYDKLHACAKHFAVHSGPEWNRHSYNAEQISPRDLWETYLPAFKTLVQQGKVKEVMCAYNRYEGDPCCGSNRLLVQILRDEWGFEDLIVSDCWAINDFYTAGHHETHQGPEDASASAVLSGTDVECGNVYAHLPEAVERGLIKESDLDISVKRLLKARFELGEMDSDELVEWSRLPMSIVSCREHQDLALRMARETMTLLQNKDNLLPLSKDGLKIAVMGPNANDSVMQWANYNGTPQHTTTILDGIRQKVGDITYLKGCDWVDTQVFDSYYSQISSNGEIGFSATYWNTVDMTGEVVATQQLGTPFKFDTGGATVFAPGVNLTDFSARYAGVFKPTVSGDVELSLRGNSSYCVRVDGDEIITGGKNGRGSSRNYKMQVQAGKAYNIEIDFMHTDGIANLRFDIGAYKEVDLDEVAARVSDVDVVVFVGGISPRLEGEEMRVNYPGFKGGDRTDIELPDVQRGLIAALKKANKKIVFVNCSGSAMALVPESENVDAILQAWYPGEAGGKAVADVLFGDYNPAGRLPVTFYKSIEQLPDFEDYNMEGRTYRYMTDKPLFPFGHGLSYTTFKYGKGKLSKRTIQEGEGVALTIELTNTGDRDGEEVVQVYIRSVEDIDGPLKSLKAFKRVHLAAGERKRVVLELPAESFERFDVNSNTMRILPGAYEILYGGSSYDLDLQKVNLKLL